MAQREALQMIRAARAGHASAQLALGRQYLFGGAGLPRNTATALYWLDRAAQQQERDAWVLIGSYIPFETVRHATNVQKLCFWYERAFAAGVTQAGVVFAKLVLSQPDLFNEESMVNRAVHALHTAAEAGSGEAQGLLAQHYKNIADVKSDSSGGGDADWMLWAEKAAQAGVQGARQLLAEDAWERQDHAQFLRWALMPARTIIDTVAHSTKVIASLSHSDIELLRRCAIAMEASAATTAQESQRLWEVTAEAGDAQAQFMLGLRLAKMNAKGDRCANLPGRVVYKKALRWLTSAAEQGVAEAGYVLSKIYLKPEFSQRDIQAAQSYLKKAAEAGHIQAQLEWGLTLWRMRHSDPDQDVRALTWLWRAAAQGNIEAQAWLVRLAPRGPAQAWAIEASRRITPAQAGSHPLLAARIELGMRLGLSRAEALLLDVRQADQGPCLVIDIRAQHPRSKRRLIAIPGGEDRQAVDRIRSLFHDVDCSMEGPEGNYRRRLYRLKSLGLESVAATKAA